MVWPPWPPSRREVYADPFAVDGDHVHVAGTNAWRTYAIPHPLVDNTWPVPFYSNPDFYRNGGATAGEGWFAIRSKRRGWAEPYTIYGYLSIYDVTFSTSYPVQEIHDEWLSFGDADMVGDGLFVVEGAPSSLSWIDMTDPRHPGNPQVVSITGIVQLSAGASGLVAAFWGEPYPHQLRTYNLTDLASPVLLGSMTFGTYNTLSDLLWLNDLVLIAAAEGLHIIDAQDPSALVLRSTVVTGPTSWLPLRPPATRIFAGNENLVLHLIAVADPAAPEHRHFRDRPFGYHRCHGRGRRRLRCQWRRLGA